MKKVFIILFILVMACAINSVCATDNIDNTTIGNDLIQNDVSITIDEFSHADILQSSANDNMDIKNSASIINNISLSDNKGVSHNCFLDGDGFNFCVYS